MYKKNKRHIRWDRVALLVISILVVIGLIFGAYHVLFANPYKEYDICNEDTKLYGTMKHESQTEEEVFYTSIYYPKYDDEALNQIVETYKKEHVKTNLKQDGMYFVSVDYDDANIYDTYVSITFHQVVKDEANKVIKKEDISYNYDLKRKILLDTKDVVRRDYIVKLKELAKKQGISEKLIKNDNLHNFIVKKDRVSFYFNNDATKTLDFVYKDNEAYVALTNKNIPSYFMKDTVIPKEQPAVQKDKKLIAFTFDDGPRNGNTQAIMDELEKYGGRGTFFMLGQNVVTYPNEVKEVYRRGHTVANHSWDHSMDISVTGRMNAAQVTDELYNTNDEIFKLIGFEPRFYRPPYGAINDTLESVNGMNMVLWDIDSKDWENHNPQLMSQIIIDHAKVGYEVVLMHDIHKETIDGVKIALKELDKLGYQFVTIDTLLEEDGKYLTSFNPGRRHNIVIPPLVGE